MLMAGFAHVMRSHLQFKAVLDNAVIRFEMQKSSLKLNNIFVTVLRGTDCLEPCWSLDLEYFGRVLAASDSKITSAILQRVLKICTSMVQSVLKKNYRYPREITDLYTESSGRRPGQNPPWTSSSGDARGDQGVPMERLGQVRVPCKWGLQGSSGLGHHCSCVQLQAG